MFQNNLCQLIHTPTHLKGNILDLILTNYVELISNVEVTPPRHSLSSDHYIISFQLLVSKSVFSREKPRYVFDFPKANLTGLCNFLLDIDFSSCLGSNNTEYVWSAIKQAIYTGMDLFIPKVRIRSYQYPVWFTPELRHLSKCIRTLNKRCTTNSTPHVLNKLQRLKENFHDKLLTAKSEYEAELIHSAAGTKNCKIFDYIRSITGNRTIPPSVSYNSVVSCSDADSANLFNSYFHSIFTKSSFPTPNPDNLPSPATFLGSISITNTEVLNSLINLDPNKSMGADNIGPKVLKHCALAIYDPLHHLFNLSLSQQVIPSEWKCHAITPIHKSGNRSLVKNYRPISLLCCVSKVLELIIFNHISEFIVSNISVCQFGFVRHRSSVQQLLLSINSILDYLDGTIKSHVDMIFLDFRKAFDSVSHNELLVKLWHFGITGDLWYWFRAYLTDRNQYVSINNYHSSLLPVISGVPQGSILGPLLFLVFINDLPDCVLNSTMLLFADDVKCSLPISSQFDCFLLQNDLDVLTVWSKYWNLCFNESKCSLVRFGFQKSSSSSHIYSINSCVIQNDSQHKDLGIIVSSDLSWTNHIRYIAAKAYKILALLRRSFHNCNSVHSKKLLYISLVRSQLIYGSQVWRPHLLKDIDALEAIQRRSTKFILNDYTIDYKSRLLSLQLLPLTMLYELNDILFFVKSLKKPNTSFNINNYFTFSSNCTRSASHHKLVHKLARTNVIKNSYFYRLPRLWNALPPIDLNLSFLSIKHNLKQFFWNHFVNNFNPNYSCTLHFLCPCHKCVCTKGHSFN